MDTIKYLGVNLGGKGRDIVREEKRGWRKKTQKLANKLMAQIKKSYDKVTVGNTIWKQIMVTALLFGKAVVLAAKLTINKVKSIENGVYKYLV